MKTGKKIITIVALVALVSILGVCLVACNAGDYSKKLVNKGYDIEIYGIRDPELLEWAFRAVKGSIDADDYFEIDGDYVTVYKYKRLSDAKEAVRESKKHLPEGMDIYRTGKIVIAGTKQGVNDAK